MLLNIQLFMWLFICQLYIPSFFQEHNLISMGIWLHFILQKSNPMRPSCSEREIPWLGGNLNLALGQYLCHYATGLTIYAFSYRHITNPNPHLQDSCPISNGKRMKTVFELPKAHNDIIHKCNETSFSVDNRPNFLSQVDVGLLIPPCIAMRVLAGMERC